MPTPSMAQLRQAIEITEQIDALKAKLAAILGGSNSSTDAPVKTRGKMPASHRAKTRSAKKGRAAKTNPEAEAPVMAAEQPPAPEKGGRAKGKGKAVEVSATPAPSSPKRKGLTPEGRAKLAAAMKARWAARKKGAPAPNAAAK